MIDIYIHTSMTSGKSYVGISAYGMEDRFKRHCFSSNIPKSHFHNAIKKYGEDDFNSNIIERVESHELAIQKEILYKKFFNTFNEGYNMTLGGEGLVGHAHSEETKRKMSEAKKGKVVSKKTREKISNSLKGNKVSEETKRKMSKARSGENHWTAKKGFSEKQRLICLNNLKKAGTLGKVYDKVTCPWCNKMGGENAMKRWHFDNCKEAI